MANGADEHSNTVSDAGNEHAITPQIQGNENSILNTSIKSKLLSGQGELKQVTPIKIDEEQENERNLALSPTRVQFSPKLVSEVHFQDKVDISERCQLFYSVYEESRWRMDKFREENRAKVQFASAYHSRPKAFLVPFSIILNIYFHIFFIFQAMGMTWAEWIEKRTDEDVKHDERYGVNPFRI